MPACYDDDLPVVFPSELEAQCEIADAQISLIRQFLDRERDFHDAISTDEFILPVELWPDGTISTPDGRRYGKAE